jgi:nitroimidazol reductase NimA-like FMN-containing flavoprotein (pyridoxamine 5'-phosphate oxidase superfamily)
MDIQSNYSQGEPSPPAAQLDDNSCWALLRTVQVGRLAVVIDGQPEIFPVNHIVDHGTVVFRTGDGTKLAAALDGGNVAYESDGFDADTAEAWSVVVKGSATEIRDLDDLIAASLLPLSPWHGAPKHRFIRIVPGQISGRRFAVVDGSIWHNPFSLRRGSAYE